MAEYREEVKRLSILNSELLAALEIALDCAGDAWWAEKAEAAIEKATGVLAEGDSKGE
jgi:hypothetical protein